MIPLQFTPVQAGFPSPADDYTEGTLDFNELLIRRPAATFCMRVSGDSMMNAGIFPGDILVIDRSITPRNGHTVIAVLCGDFTVKTLRIRNGRTWLQAANPAYRDIEPGENEELTVWGVVTSIVRLLHPSEAASGPQRSGNSTIDEE